MTSTLFTFTKGKTWPWALLVFLLSLSSAAASTFLNPLFLTPLIAFFAFFTLVAIYRKSLYFFWGLILLAPFNDHLGVNLGSLNLRIYTLFVFLLFSWLLMIFISRKPVFEMQALKKLSYYFIPLICVVISKILTLFITPEMAPGMTKFFSFKLIIIQSILYLMGFFVAIFLSNKERLEKFFIYLIYINNGILILAAIQLFLSNVFHFEFVHHRHVIFFGRPYSVFREPDVLGCFIASLFLIEFSLFISKIHLGKSPKFIFYSLLFTVFFLFILFVRAAWLAAIVGFLFIIFYQLITNNQAMISKILNRIALGTVLVLTFTFIISPQAILHFSDRLFSIANSSKESASQYRKQELDGMIQHILPSKFDEKSLYLLSFGYGDFSWSFWGPYLLGDDYDQDAKKNASQGGVLIHPGFCLPISLLHDNGLSGVIFYLWFFLGLGSLFHRDVMNTKDPLIKGYLIAAMSAILSVIVCYIFSYDPIFPYFWVLIGLLLGIHYIKANNLP